MTGERYVLLGLARPRSAWFRALGQWANAASLPAELVKCLSIEDLRSRLQSARQHSAVVIDGSLPAVDRDLIAAAHRAGSTVIVVDDLHPRTHWAELAADAVLAAGFERSDLIDALSTARLLGRSDVVPAVLDISEPPVWQGRVVMVCGSGGTGVSTVAMALAQGLGDDVRQTGLVVLADLARHAEQAVLHDAGDIVPGIQELVEAHRRGRPDDGEVRSLTYDVVDRGYQLLLGLRRPAAWTAMGPHAVEASLSSLAGVFRVVICDVDCDVEGESEGGSIDVEERNVFARTTAGRADVVFAVGQPGVKGVYSLIRVIGELLAFGVAAESIIPVVNRTQRGHRTRSELRSTLEALLPPDLDIGRAVLVPERHIDDVLRDRARLPSSIVDPLLRALRTAADPRPDHRSVAGPDLQPIAAGSLGTAPADGGTMAGTGGQPWSDAGEDRAAG